MDALEPNPVQIRNLSYRSQSKRNLPPPFPSGWYCVGHINDFAVNQVYSEKFLGQEIIVFKTSKHKLVAMDAYCPHLGAHLGRVMHGRPNQLKNDCIECVYHHLTYNEYGECVSNRHGIIAPKARVRVWDVEVVDNLVFVYFSMNNEPPSWRMPFLSEPNRQWTPLFKTYEGIHTAHPQEVFENVVDTYHFFYLA